MNIEELKKLRKENEKAASKLEAAQAKAENTAGEFEKELEKYGVAVCLDSLIVGTRGMTMRHGAVAPYTTDYYVTEQSRNGNSDNPVEYSYCRRITSSSWQKLPKLLYNYLHKEKDWGLEEFSVLEKETNQLWDQLPKGYHTNVYNRDKYDTHVANGYETDGFDEIIRGHCQGTWSNYTTCSQNDLARTLILLKGYCLDYNGFGATPEVKELMKEVFSRHGLDADIDDATEWAKRNPARCFSENPAFVDLRDIERTGDDSLEL